MKRLMATAVTFFLLGGSVVAAQTSVSIGIQIGPPPPPRVVYVPPPAPATDIRVDPGVSVSGQAQVPSGTTDIGLARPTPVLSGLPHDTTDGCSTKATGQATTGAENMTIAGITTATAITVTRTTRATDTTGGTRTASDSARRDTFDPEP